MLRQRLLFQHLAQGGSGALERRLAILGWQGDDGFLRGALDAARAAVAGAAAARSTASTLPDKLRHNLPDWLAGALREQLGDDEFWPLVERAERSRRRWTCASTRFKAKREEVQRALAEAGIDGRADAVLALGPARAGQAGAAQAGRVHRAARSRCRTKAASCWRC